MKKTQKEYNSTNALRYSKKVHGDDNDIDMKIYITESLISVRDKHNPDDTNLTVVSPWHDIPLYCNNNQGILNGIINMVVEIPRHTRNKIEINKHMQINPLTHDIRNGSIRRIMYGDGYPAHYGALPQTWEDPHHIDQRTGLVGDDDPMDVFDISLIPVIPGDVIQIKVLGSIAMIDQGETDWKVIGINIKDPLSVCFNDISDISVDNINHIIDFLKNYKVCDGNGVNTFHQKILWDRAHTLDIVADQHSHWKQFYARMHCL